MGKFGALFADSDDESPPPPVVVPKPPSGNVEVSPPPPVAPCTELSSSPSGVPEVAPPPPTEVPLPVPENEDTSQPVRSSGLADPAVPAVVEVIENPSTLAQSMPAITDTPKLEPGAMAQSLPTDLSQQEVKLKPQSNVGTAELAASLPFSELQAQMTEILQKLDTVAPQRSESLPIPSIDSFPAFKNYKAAADAKVEFDEKRMKAWQEEVDTVKTASHQIDLAERDRDGQLIQKHNADQISQLRREKDELRKAYEDAMADLAQKESQLQQMTAKEGEDMLNFKKSFNELMKAQRSENTELQELLKDERARSESLYSQLADKTQLCAEQASKLKEHDLTLASLKVQCADLEKRLLLTNNHLEISQTRVTNLCSQVQQMDDEKAQLCDRLDEAVKSKYEYIAELRRKYDSHLELLGSRYEEREQFFTNEYVTKEAALREDLLKFADTLRLSAEGMVEKYRLERDREGKRLSDSFFSQAKEMKQKHKAEIAELTLARDLLRKEHKKSLQAAEEHFNRRAEEMRRAQEKEAEEARKRLEQVTDAADRRYNTATSELRKEMAAKAAEARQEMVKSVQQAVLEGKGRLAEMETQHRLKEKHLEKTRADDKEQLMSMFSRELQKIGEEHRKAERELEKLHRDREAELEKRVKQLTAEQTQAGLPNAAETTKMKDDFMSKFDTHRQNLRDRHDNFKKSLEDSG